MISVVTMFHTIIIYLYQFSGQNYFKIPKVFEYFRKFPIFPQNYQYSRWKFTALKIQGFIVIQVEPDKYDENQKHLSREIINDWYAMNITYPIWQSAVLYVYFGVGPIFHCNRSISIELLCSLKPNPIKTYSKATIHTFWHPTSEIMPGLYFQFINLILSVNCLLKNKHFGVPSWRIGMWRDWQILSRRMNVLKFGLVQLKLPLTPQYVEQWMIGQIIQCHMM